MKSYYLQLCTDPQNNRQPTILLAYEVIRSIVQKKNAIIIGNFSSLNADCGLMTGDQQMVKDLLLSKFYSVDART